jgi:hypothetical protein
VLYDILMDCLDEGVIADGLDKDRSVVVMKGNIGEMIFR